jgi:hypothetical protein
LPRRDNEEFSRRASMSTAAHGAFAEMPWPFAHAEMPGSRNVFILHKLLQPNHKLGKI